MRVIWKMCRRSSSRCTSLYWMRICNWTVESPSSLASVIVLPLVHYILPPLMQLALQELLVRREHSFGLGRPLLGVLLSFVLVKGKQFATPKGNEFSPFKQLGLQCLQSSHQWRPFQMSLDLMMSMMMSIRQIEVL